MIVCLYPLLQLYVIFLFTHAKIIIVKKFKHLYCDNKLFNFLLKKNYVFK